MNQTYCSVWSESRQECVVAPETARSRGRWSSKAASLAPALYALALAASNASAADLPAGGTVVAGAGTIASNGAVMTINQGTSRLAIDWQSFNIGQGKSVNFVQPGAGAVALNRVLGTDVSVIQGAINANGQVFLINPNGVLFTPTAQVNVGGLVASTLSLRTDDFMAGRYQFAGTSSNAIVNQANVSAPGGTIALIAAKIINTGQLAADQGHVLLGAGSDVTLDLGGPVKLRVNQGALDALIDQGGAIRASGGLVYLTAKAAGELASTVINHTGITEAQTLATGEKGQIVLLGGMDKDRIAVGGRLDASAPHGGDGGFIETSASKVVFADNVAVQTHAPGGKTGHWLIDPLDFTIASSGGDITGSALGNLLNSNSVTIQTTGGTNSGTSLYSSVSGNGDIIVNDAITKSSGSATTLTLAADRDIAIYSAGTISGSAGSPLNVVLAARANGGSTGTVTVMGTLRTYGGNITIGGGDMTASGYAVAPATYNNRSTPVSSTYYAAGVDIGAMLDATGDGSGVASASMPIAPLPTASSGGNITIRGQGSATATSTYNWGVHVDYFPSRSHYAAIVTGGSGNIQIVGYGGNGGNGGSTNYYALASVGLAIEGTAFINANNGNITLKGYKGTGLDQYGIATGSTQIGTHGWISIDGDSLLLRTGTLTLAADRDSDIKPPIVGCSYSSWYMTCASGTRTLAKQGTGVLNLWGDASYWNANRPANTVASTVGTATFTDAGNAVNVVGITQAQAFYAFATPAAAVTPVTQSTSPATSVTTLTYSLSDVGLSTSLTYKGSAYSLSDYWTASSIFGSGGSGLVLGTDYTFLYNGNAVTGFTNAGTYSGITVSLSKANYALATTGNTSGSFRITPRALTIGAPTIASRAYDGGTAAGALTLGALSGFVTGETVTASGTAAALAGRDVGSYTTSVAYTLADGTGNGKASNYSLASSTGITAAITPRPLTIGVPSIASRAYDGSTAAGALTLGALSGFVTGETVTASGTAAALAGRDVGSYTTSVAYTLADGTGNGKASNYSLASSTGITAAITPRPLTIGAPSIASRAYDGSTAAGALTLGALSGFVTGETVTASGTAAALSGRNVGSYTTSVAYTLTDGTGNGKASNYSLASSTGVTAAITPRALAIAADNQSKLYGAQDPALTWQITSGSLVTGDSLSGALTRSTGENAGTYAIDASALGNPNYRVTAGNGALTIRPRPITVAADNQSKLVGNPDPALSWQVTAGALLQGDALTGSLIRARGESVGSYLIDASRLANGNYAVTALNGTLTIKDSPGSSAAIANTQSQALADPNPARGVPARLSSPANRLEASPSPAGSPAVGQSGGLILVDATESPAERPVAAAGTSQLAALPAGQDASGFVRVLVVRGGLNTDFALKDAR